MFEILIAASALTLATPTLNGPSDASLRAADAEQMRIIVDGDARAQRELMHPNYMVNAPANRVLVKAQVVAMLDSGQIGSDNFRRTIERTAITRNVGIVMGDETVIPAPDSALGRLHPGKTLRRRFTNVFLWEGGKWLFLARQASVVAP
ncbi:MAG TPA: nuclear transport factor 2 family protein [Sphingomicrobium sp.]|nr:nuclear transport factor 2 family protein [Sphingomicrobium sp.]